MKVLAAMLLSVIMLSSGFMINSPATAAPNENANDNAKRSFTLPDNAVEIAPGVFHIGTVLYHGKVVDGIAVFEHKPKHNPGGPGGGGDDDTTNPCFSYIFGKGVKWKALEEYVVDPTNTRGLDEQTVKNRIADAIGLWESASGVEIMGDETTSGTVDGIDDVRPDGKNEVLFGDIGDKGAIAVNISWAIIRGPPSDRQLVEWDQMYDDIDYDWSLSGEAEKMDFLNIAAHEVGHAAGMGHPDNICTDETMYAFADFGETKKQDLFDGDIAGIQNLY